MIRDVPRWLNTYLLAEIRHNIRRVRFVTANVVKVSINIMYGTVVIGAHG